MNPADLALPFLAGLGFSGHCLGMCGPFALSLRTGAGRGVAFRLALYHLGKGGTYAFLGLLAWAGASRLAALQRPLGLAAGALLLAVGLLTLFPRQIPERLTRLVQGSAFCDLLSPLLRSPRLGTALALGAFSGFLPCGLVYAMAARAATLPNAAAAALQMLAFAAGTVPSLAALSLFGEMLGRRVAAGSLAPLLRRAAGLVAIVLGALALLRAAGPLAGAHAHLHP